MRRLTRVFATRRMLLIWNHVLVRLPEVTVTVSVAVSTRYLLPQLLPGGLASIANDVGDDLSGGTTQRNPYPALSDLFQPK